MDTAFNDQIRPKLDVLDRIRPYVQDLNLELPGIVVVGDQSSGELSTLWKLAQALVSDDFSSQEAAYI